MAIDAERAYEQQRAAVVAHYTAQGESLNTAEKQARVDSTVLELAHQHTMARSDLRRYEGHVAHYRFLIEHTPAASH